ncbi:hypothetical protein ACFPJ1_12055 [Kribbella qitaiheensis]
MTADWAQHRCRDKFKLIDNLDALTATLDGVRAAGVRPKSEAAT